MHELSVASSIADIAVRHARGRQVSAVHVKVGALRQVVPDSLAFYFEIVARETVCAGASLEIEAVPAAMRCRECGTGWDPAPEPEHDFTEFVMPQFRCPGCGAAGAEVLAGDELLVDSIDVEEPGRRGDPAAPYASDPAAAGTQGG